VGGRRGSGGRKSKGEGRSTGQAIIIDLDNLARYRYLSFAWFVRMAVAWLVGQDLFEKPLDPGTINNVLAETVEEAKALKLSEKARDEVIKHLQGNEDVNLYTEYFMDWEVKEHTRVFGGRGREVREFFKARPYVVGLYLLGMELTRVRNNVYLFIEPHIYLIGLSLSLNKYREFYNNIRNLVREYERRANNKEKNINETALMATLAGLVVNNLRRYKVGMYRIRELIGVGGNVFVLYRVDKRGGVTPLDLTNLVKHILELERVGLSVSRTLAGLAGRFVSRKRGGDIIDSINTVGDAVFKYTITGDLGYIYNMTRTVTTSEGYAEVRDSLLGVGGGGEGGDSEGLGTV